VVTGIEPTTSGLLDQQRRRSDNHFPSPGTYVPIRTQKGLKKTKKIMYYCTYCVNQVVGRTAKDGDIVPIIVLVNY